MKKLKEKHGITLIALVVTIVVLLILAGVSITLVLGENGIINKTKDAKEKNKSSSDIEIIKMALSLGNMEYQAETYPEGEDVFLNELKKTDPNANVNYDNYPDVIVFYNKDYYQVDFERNNIEKYDPNVARIGSKYYQSLQSAFDDVQTNNEETTVYLLKDIKEYCQIEKNKNIILELEQKIIEGAIENNGMLKVYNGKISEPGEFTALSNYGTLEMDGVELKTMMSNDGTATIKNCKFEGQYMYTVIRNLGEIVLYNSEIQGYNAIDNWRKIHNRRYRSFK